MIVRVDPSNPAPLFQQVVGSVKEAVATALLVPGDKLPSERELMATYQVGRPAIREAMQNLQRSGLVRIRHGERPRVAEPSMDWRRLSR